jgi:DNA (cytosine-5)-methyltransferase 1
VVIASRTGEPTFPSRTHGPEQTKPYVTVRDAIGSFPAIRAGQTHRTIPNHRASDVSKLNMRRLKATPSNGGSRSDWPHSLRLECHSGDYAGHSDVYGRLKWDAPAPTLTCRCYSISNGRYVHPKQNRAISFREAAALQTFPNDYIFYGLSQRVIGSQIGNAVPVLLAKSLGLAILQDHRKRCPTSSPGKSGPR